MTNTTTSKSISSSNKGIILPSDCQKSSLPEQAASPAAGTSHDNPLPDAPGDSLFAKALQNYHAWKSSSASRMGGPRSIGEILRIMFGPIEDHATKPESTCQE